MSFKKVWKEMRRQWRLSKKDEWRERMCLWPKVVYDPDKCDRVIIWPGTVYYERYIIGHYGYEGNWYASTRKFGNKSEDTSNL